MSMYAGPFCFVHRFLHHVDQPQSLCRNRHVWVIFGTAWFCVVCVCGESIGIESDLEFGSNMWEKTSCVACRRQRKSMRTDRNREQSRNLRKHIESVADHTISNVFWRSMSRIDANRYESIWIDANRDEAGRPRLSYQSMWIDTKQIEMKPDGLPGPLPIDANAR